MTGSMLPVKKEMDMGEEWLQLSVYKAREQGTGNSPKGLASRREQE